MTHWKLDAINEPTAVIDEPMPVPTPVYNQNLQHSLDQIASNQASAQNGVVVSKYGQTAIEPEVIDEDEDANESAIGNSSQIAANQTPIRREQHTAQRDHTTMIVGAYQSALPGSTSGPLLTLADGLKLPDDYHKNPNIYETQPSYQPSADVDDNTGTGAVEDQRIRAFRPVPRKRPLLHDQQLQQHHTGIGSSMLLNYNNNISYNYNNFINNNIDKESAPRSCSPSHVKRHRIRWQSMSSSPVVHQHQLTAVHSDEFRIGSSRSLRTSSPQEQQSVATFSHMCDNENYHVNQPLPHPYHDPTPCSSTPSMLAASVKHVSPVDLLHLNNNQGNFQKNLNDPQQNLAEKHFDTIPHQHDEQDQQVQHVTRRYDSQSDEQSGEDYYYYSGDGSNNFIDANQQYQQYDGYYGEINNNNNSPSSSSHYLGQQQPQEDQSLQEASASSSSSSSPTQQQQHFLASLLQRQKGMIPVEGQKVYPWMSTSLHSKRNKKKS